ncbi:MAG: gluconate 2-dehydrogenase subunit 3 family protein [Bacteroidetes bacterium]|nr:gluconate 2-dehydrogenase subunit 3 family protein [Bacteroidota bacterium]
MNRRTVIKNFLVFSAGATLIPSCMHEETKSSILLKNIKINGDQEKMISELSEAIIPKTDTPGAKDLSSHLFVLMMVDDCATKEDQQKFMAGMNQFEALAKKDYGNSFATCTSSQKNELLKKIENKKEVSEKISSFYATTKRLTIQSFTSSQYFLTKVQVYEMIPGRYHGCVPVKNNS